ncbi:hypothetical protein CROQUDRAFT_659838 [Cronartium quercuum f. sp. fusiforme G11]|uniref:Peptidase S53 activation domain-containing protein n=1 Tax=Cronartium quercuum f. sp. fusiforme G11 TaxID=708437 RepID=A0A9P6NEL1_9BASI|nr:hypothetical protein CROQUDRAFT_659838 [Cronartium quercuum f. sp. fusiforme G11]
MNSLSQRTIQSIKSQFSQVELGSNKISFDGVDQKIGCDYEGYTFEKKTEEMLKTSCAICRHLDGDYLIRTERFSLPDYLHQHIDVVQPTTMIKLRSKN